LIIFTSITFNYLDKAIALVESVRRHQPEAAFHLVIGDYPREGVDELLSHYFDAVAYLDTFSEASDEAWLFSHTLVELCTALKPLYASRLLNEGHEHVVYLDPDTVMFSSFRPLIEAHKGYQVVLTPHLTEPPTEWQGVLDNELSAGRHGLYNLGFFSLYQSPESLEFCQWWANRLARLCVGTTELGMFTDQRVVDHAPVFFPYVGLLRHRGFNMATWNLAERPLRRVDNTLLIDDEKLVFYHFTGYDSGAGRTMLVRYGANAPAVATLWRWYRMALRRIRCKLPQNLSWSLDQTRDGRIIPDSMRRYYRFDPMLQQLLPKPFDGALLWDIWDNSESVKRHQYEERMLANRTVRSFQALGKGSSESAATLCRLKQQLENTGLSEKGRILLWGSNAIAQTTEQLLLAYGVDPQRVYYIDRDDASIGGMKSSIPAEEYSPLDGDIVIVCAQHAATEIRDKLQKFGHSQTVEVVLYRE